MRLLLDTHVAIWALTQSTALSPKAREMIAASNNAIFVSVATIWEIAFKHPRKKRSAPPLSAADSIASFERAGFELLDVKAAHAAAVETLPLIHADPFDRLIVGQALTEPLVLLTHDTIMTRYSDTIIRV